MPGILQRISEIDAQTTPETAVPRVREDFLTGVLITLVALVIYFVAIPYGVPVPQHIPANAIGPDAWPRVSTLLLMLFGVLIALRGLNRGNSTPDADRPATWTSRSQDMRRISGSFAVLFGAAALIPIIGLPGAGGLVIVVLGFAFGERRALILGAVAIVLPVFLYVFFTRIAGVPIPLGYFGD